MMWIRISPLWITFVICLTVVRANTEIVNFNTKRSAEDPRAAKSFRGHDQ